MEPTTAQDAPTSTTKNPFLQGKRLPSAIVAGGAAFAMTLAGLGIAAAQTDDATPTTPASSTAPAEGEGDHRPSDGAGHPQAKQHPRLSVAAEALGISTADLKAEFMAGKSIGQVAEAKGVDQQKVIDALVADATATLNAAVESGRIAREQADARIATLPERMREAVERTRPAGDEGPGHRGPGEHRLGAKPDPAKLAELLGITPEQLKAGHEAGKSLATLATENRRDPQTVIDALVADARAKLSEAVTNGTLTQAEADERSANLVERITAMVNGTPRASDGERKGPGGERRPHLRANLEAAAGALGMSIEDLRTELQAGKSLAAIAGDKGVPVGQVVSALVSDAKARIASAVTDGKLTQAQADERLAELDQRISDLVNRTPRADDGERRHPGPDADAPTDGHPEAEPATLTA